MYIQYSPPHAPDPRGWMLVKGTGSAIRDNNWRGIMTNSHIYCPGLVRGRGSKGLWDFLKSDRILRILDFWIGHLIMQMLLSRTIWATSNSSSRFGGDEIFPYDL